MPPLPKSSLLLRGASTLYRLFSSSTPKSRPQQQIPPESPLFINIPNPPQDQSIEALRELKPVKGHLPLPRTVFRRRDGHLKPTSAWLTRSAPEPTNAKSQQPPKSEIQAWKRRVAASRRENMREGVRALYARKQRFDRQRLERQTAILTANRLAAMAPEREDERLTRASINAGTLATAVLPDPERFERALTSQARTSQLHAAKSEARRDAIQELYMKARSFIVDETALEAEVDRLFAEDYWEAVGNTASGHETRNVWDLDGRQQAVADMVNEVSRTSNAVVKSLDTERNRTLRRQKKVAEELTGGKLDGI
ncbi:hypothetical protein F5Y04DRAFT_103953 [Hypomontagnella monticulosa]|nr:hypothetical protein F5Y04DRAFT_103953 [Hypomontagnella monticulosa]